MVSVLPARLIIKLTRQISKRKSKFKTWTQGDSHKHENFEDGELTSGLRDILEKGERGSQMSGVRCGSPRKSTRLRANQAAAAYTKFPTDSWASPF